MMFKKGLTGQAFVWGTLMVLFLLGIGMSFFNTLTANAEYTVSDDLQSITGDSRYETAYQTQAGGASAYFNQSADIEEGAPTSAWQYVQETKENFNVIKEVASESTGIFGIDHRIIFFFMILILVAVVFMSITYVTSLIGGFLNR